MDALVASREANFLPSATRMMIKFHLLFGNRWKFIKWCSKLCKNSAHLTRPSDDGWWLSEVKEDLDDEARSGRLVTATSPDVEDKMAAVRQDRRLTTRHVLEMVGVSYNFVNILIENLGKRQVDYK